MKQAPPSLALLLLLTAVSLLPSCTVDLDRPFPPHESRLVIQSFLSPGDSVRVYLSRSYGPLDRVTLNDLLVPDANLRISINGNAFSQIDFRDTTFVSFFDTPSSYYVGRDATVSQGSRVRVEATHPDYGTATGETVIPTPARVKQVEIIQNAFRQAFGANDVYTQSILRVTYEPPQGEVLFYRLDQAYIEYRDPNNPSIPRGQGLTILGPAVPASDGGFESQERYVRHDGQSGELVVDYLCEFPDAFVPIQDWRELLVDTLYLDNEYANPDYGRYQETLALQAQSGGGVAVFPSEPVALFSNIEGGYGVLGGFVVRRDTVRF